MTSGNNLKYDKVPSTIYYMSPTVPPGVLSSNAVARFEAAADLIFPSNSTALNATLAALSTALTTVTTTAAVASTDSASYNDDDYLNSLTDEEYIDYVTNFLQPTFIEMCFVVIFLCLMIVGITGNCLVVYVVSRNKSMWSTMNIFLTNLALSDLLVLTFCLPPTVINDITKTFWFSAASCKAILFFQNVSVYVSVLTLMCISVERWKAISNPLSIPFWRTSQVVVVTWVLSTILSLPEPFTLEIYPADYARTNLSTKWGTRCMESWSPDFQQKYQLTQTIVLFLTPLLIISGFCVHMSMILRRKALQISSRQLRDRQRAIKMLVTVVLIFAISYLPVHLHNIATAFHFDATSEQSLTVIAFRKFVPRFMSYSSSCLNPILYNFMSEKFRKEFRRACHFGSSLSTAKERYYYSSGAFISRDNLSNSTRLPYTAVNCGRSISVGSPCRSGSPIGPYHHVHSVANGMGAAQSITDGATRSRASLTRYNSMGNTSFRL